jgi:hypothetical protein
MILTPERRILYEKRLAQMKEQMEPYLENLSCKCGCHRNHYEASINGIEAKLRGGFHYYHEDCFCCMSSWNFSALIKKEPSSETNG